MKLSNAQLEMLHSAVHGNGGCAESYPPAKKLVALGFCIGHGGGFGSYRLVPTDAGRALIELKEAT